MKQREEGQGPDCPLAMAAEHQSELSIPSPLEKKPNEVEFPPHSVAGVERSVDRKGWEETMQSEFDGHIKTGPFDIVDRVPKGRKPVSLKWCLDYKRRTKKEK